MASSKQQESMLLTEHFTWPPISLIDDIINAVNEVLYRCTDSFETGLSAADPSLLGFADLYAAQGRTPEKDEDGQDIYPEAKLEIEEGVLKLETLMENAVDKNFDKLEIWTLRNVFALGRGKGGDEGLGDWVRLGHYEKLEPPSKDPNLTPEALYTLRRKLIETRKLNAVLIAEKTRNDAQIARLRALVQPNTTTTTTTTKRESRTSTSPTEQPPNQNNNAPFSFLTHTPAAQSLGLHSLPAPLTSTTSDKNTEKTAPLTTHTTFTTSQLPHLRQLLASLKPHLPTTALPSNTTPSHSSSSSSSSAAAATGGAAGLKGKEELTRERKVYVESQSKRILERRGVDTKDGVEGVWEGSSRVRAEEVRGLEGLVAGLNRRGNGDTGMGAKEKEEEDEKEKGEEDPDAMDTS
ncbi:MIND kinetochore complex component Mtw1 [Pyrenophora seminiperda CCB06]|uniref:MIND kinetochore complex component Mtw1 n=1 Tax=Pyrenophora seminiperda CCB06 TaxID=1302712 RepID=A0A3M7M2D8_9PLEO|nr:MIND kinetochore complex component Mtw1 [Pyrenophora seminiperda CCB06]